MSRHSLGKAGLPKPRRKNKTFPSSTSTPLPPNASKRRPGDKKVTTESGDVSEHEPCPDAVSSLPGRVLAKHASQTDKAFASQPFLGSLSAAVWNSQKSVVDQLVIKLLPDSKKGVPYAITYKLRSLVVGALERRKDSMQRRTELRNWAHAGLSQTELLLQSKTCYTSKWGQRIPQAECRWLIFPVSLEEYTALHPDYPKNNTRDAVEKLVGHYLAEVGDAAVAAGYENDGSPELKCRTCGVVLIGETPETAFHHLLWAHNFEAMPLLSSR